MNPRGRIGSSTSDAGPVGRQTDAETRSIEISRSREAVWELITTIDGIPGWYEDWDRCLHDAAEDHLKDGTAFQLTAVRRPMAVLDCQVVTAEAPTLLRWIEHLPHHAPVLVEFRLEELTPTSTLLAHTKAIGRPVRPTGRAS